MFRFLVLGSTAILLTSAGCVSLPSKPSVMVLPGDGLSFEQFHNDDVVCQQYAYSQLGEVSANPAEVSSGVTSAVVGSAFGAATGAILGGRLGAAIGAGVGLVAGSIAGTGAATRSNYEAQQCYDNAYIQCMYANGHQVPVSGSFSNVQTRRPRSANIPPPPQGLPPPPPKK